MDTTVRNNRSIGSFAKYSEALSDKYGKQYEAYRQKWEDGKQLKLTSDFPLHIDLDSVDSCNLACKYCDARNNFPRRETHLKISDDIVRGLFSEIKSPKGKDTLCSLNLGCLGEPLLNLAMTYEVFKRCNETRVMERYLHTNGVLLDLDVFKNLAELGLTHLFVSIDAHREDTYKELRGGDLRKVHENVISILEYKKSKKLFFPAVRVSFLSVGQSQEEVIEFAEFWAKRVDKVDIQPACNWLIPLDQIKVKGKMKCPQPWQRMSIGPQGELNACCAAISDEYIDKQKLGDFPATSLYDAWNGAKVKRLREQMRKMRMADEFHFCRECILRTSFSAAHTIRNSGALLEH
jgi:sulfatase maturation enzyme AslB (radical SAM superfamily)